jgi:hypothetical protein
MIENIENKPEKVANDYRQLKDDCFRRYSFK